MSVLKYYLLNWFIISVLTNSLYDICHKKSMPIVIIMDEKYILNRLIELRNALKQSGNAFAKKLNIPQTTYLRYETGQRKISADLII